MNVLFCFILITVPYIFALGGYTHISRNPVSPPRLHVGMDPPAVIGRTGPPPTQQEGGRRSILTQPKRPCPPDPHAVPVVSRVQLPCYVSLLCRVPLCNRRVYVRRVPIVGPRRCVVCMPIQLIPKVVFEPKLCFREFPRRTTTFTAQISKTKERPTNKY